MKLRAAVAGAVVGAAMIGALAGPASADLDDYLNNPGRGRAGEVGAQCGSGAGSGAFGFYGPGNNRAHTVIGYERGLDNSALCGNRQGNLP